MVALDPLQRGPNRLGEGDIELRGSDRDTFGRQDVGCGLRRFGVSSAEHDLDTGPTELPADLMPESVVSAGHQRHTISGCHEMIIRKSLPQPIGSKEETMNDSDTDETDVLQPSPTPVDSGREHSGLAPGRRFGCYEIVERLGAGGMGEVWRVWDPSLEREVALKVLPVGAVADERARARLLREARMASKLNHPNICTIYEVGEAEDQAYIAMELVAGEALSDRLAAGRLPEDEVLRLGRQMADALEHAHSNGVVHRDFKSANVVITPEGRAKVLDFGLAARMSKTEINDATTFTADSLELPGMIAGTLPYMAPELLRGEPANASSDIWALGVVLYELASGERPFKGTTGFELSSAILRSTPPPLPPGPGGSQSTRLQSVVGRCLEKETGTRYPNAGEVREALEMAGMAVPETPGSILKPGSLGRRWLFPVVGLVGVLAVLSALDVGDVRRFLGGEKVGGVEPVRMAVLPFVNLSGDPEQEYLSDGFTQEMITQLGKLHPEGLSVIARTSVMRYKNGDTPVDQIGRELDVDYVLEGSTQREAGRVRVAADLIQVNDQTQLWADSFERELAGILEVQSAVAQEVAQALALKLLPVEKARLIADQSVDPEAYEAYLKGTMHWMMLTPSSLDQAERYFEQAIEDDPSYAPAHAGLAWVWGARQQFGVSPPSEAGPKAKAAAERAIALDESSDVAHEALATISTWTDWDWDAAEREWRRTLELNPNNASAHAYYAHFLAIVGRVDEAVEHAERSIELDPYNPLLKSLYGVVLNFDGRYDDAIATARAALELQPGSPVADFVLQTAFIAKGMKEEQLELQRERIARDPGRVAAFEEGLSEGGYEGAQLAIADLLAERYEVAKGVPDAGTRQVLMPDSIAWRYCDAGDYQRAIDWLEEAFEVRDPNLPYIGDPAYAPLRSDPRFQKLVHRMGLPPLPVPPS
ncbi:MAG TPA: protein kinase [Candidatus Sulfomarinibacteraceae bacterium]|nr:protein kinase [Candidatus Sulfomarinibacteraceae bacterium]